MIHPWSAVEKVTLPANERGLGITCIPRLHSKQVQDLRRYCSMYREENKMFDITCAVDNTTPL